MSRFLIGLTSLLLFLGLSRKAAAHAFLDHAEPHVGSTIAKAPGDVRIWFTQAIEPAFSRVEVFDAAGKEVDKKDSHVDPKDHHVLVVSTPPLSPGKYKVSWRVVSVDTHRTQGDFEFVVKP